MDKLSIDPGRVAIITGAGQGLGKQVAYQLGQMGVRVAVNDQNPDRAQRVAEAICAAGGTAIGIAADVANKFQCVHLIETTRAEWGRLDILVNNAAIMSRSSILKMDEWEWNRALEVNLKGAFFMSQLCGRVMADENGERGGWMVNVGSVAGIEGALPGRGAYCASKAGLVGFTRECAREFAEFGVWVNMVLPTETENITNPTVKAIISLCSSTQGGQIIRVADEEL